MEQMQAYTGQFNDAVAARVWRLNLQLSTEVLNEAADRIAALGLDVKEYFVLDGVEERPYPAELARCLSIPRPSMTLHLKNLQAKGFLVRNIDPVDQRRHRLELTEAGRTAVTGARAILHGQYGQRLVRLSDAEQTQFAALLEKLTAL
jgi:DNA-binding MarR family transcriptional regulator